MQMFVLTCNKGQSAVLSFRLEVTSHFNNCWQVKNNHRHFRMGFGELVCHGTRTAWENQTQKYHDSL